MATQGKGKNKKGTKAVPLDLFLNEGNQATQGFKLVHTTNWAEAMEDEEIDDTFTLKFNSNPGKVLLPTAPKATRGPDIDMTRIPTQPPFKAYLGNLSYDISESELEKLFEKLNLKEIRLIKDNGRPKGYGYAEFNDRDSLIAALAKNGDVYKNRSLRVGLPGEDNAREPREDRQQQDRTAGDWRSATRDEMPQMNREPQPHRNGSYDGYPDRGMQRGRTNYDNNDVPYGNRNRGGFENDRFDKPNDRNYNRHNDRGSYDNRPNQRHFPERTFGRSRNFDGDSNYERNDRNFGGQDKYPANKSDYNREDRYGNSKRYEEPREQRYDRGGGFNDRGFNNRKEYQVNDRPIDRPIEKPKDEDYQESEVQEVPKVRPKLNLKPRTAPKEETSDQPAVNSAIFGGAKPVNTAARELEIEKRLLKEKEEVEKKKDAGSSTFSSSNERTRRISAGSNVSGSTRSRKGSDTGPSREHRDSYEEQNEEYRNNTMPRTGGGGSSGGGYASNSRPRKYSERSNQSDRTDRSDSGPKHILRRNEQPRNNQQTSAPRIFNSVQHQQQQRQQRGDQRQRDQRDLRPQQQQQQQQQHQQQQQQQGNYRSKTYDNRNYRAKNEHQRVENIKPPRYNRSDDNSSEDKIAYTSSNKFAHLHDEVEDNEGNVLD